MNKITPRNNEEIEMTEKKGKTYRSIEKFREGDSDTHIQIEQTNRRKTCSYPETSNLMFVVEEWKLVDLAVEF